MQRTTAFLIFIFIILNSLAFSQDSTRTMRSYVPESNAYDLYYPLDFVLQEDEGIITITDSISGLNITVSSYFLVDPPTDVDIIESLNSFINENYNKQLSIEDWNSYHTDFDNLVELKTYFEGANWVWYGINNKTTLVLLSLNKETEITQEEMLLVKFMIDHLIIN